MEYRQPLLGMPDIDVLNIINIYINSIGTEHDGGSDNYCTNKPTSKSADEMQVTDSIKKYHTNTEIISKSHHTDKPIVNNKLSNTIDYFLPGPIKK